MQCDAVKPIIIHQQQQQRRIEKDLLWNEELNGNCVNQISFGIILEWWMGWVYVRMRGTFNKIKTGCNQRMDQSNKFIRKDWTNRQTVASDASIYEPVKHGKRLMDRFVCGIARTYAGRRTEQSSEEMVTMLFWC